MPVPPSFYTRARDRAEHFGGILNATDHAVSGESRAVVRTAFLSALIRHPERPPGAPPPCRSRKRNSAHSTTAAPLGRGVCRALSAEAQRRQRIWVDFEFDCKSEWDMRHLQATLTHLTVVVPHVAGVAEEAGRSLLVGRQLRKRTVQRFRQRCHPVPTALVVAECNPVVLVLLRQRRPGKFLPGVPTRCVGADAVRNRCRDSLDAS